MTSLADQIAKEQATAAQIIAKRKAMRADILRQIAEDEARNPAAAAETRAMFERGEAEFEQRVIRTPAEGVGRDSRRLGLRID